MGLQHFILPFTFLGIGLVLSTVVLIIELSIKHIGESGRTAVDVDVDDADVEVADADVDVDTDVDTEVDVVAADVVGDIAVDVYIHEVVIVDLDGIDNVDDDDDVDDNVVGSV